MNKNEDIAWVTRCALFDDRRAFACLVDKYQVRLKRFFLNLTGGDPVLSDDLAQETFIKVYYNLRSYKGLSSFSTWIYRVAYNVFYDELRKSREWEDASVDEVANLLEQPPECVDRNIDISRALSILRPEERTAITLFFVEDLAVANIKHRTVQIAITSTETTNEILASMLHRLRGSLFNTLRVNHLSVRSSNE